VEQITHVLPADDPRGVPHVAFHRGDAVGMGNQLLCINHDTRSRCASVRAVDALQRFSMRYRSGARGRPRVPVPVHEERI
jgi:hypothetical protein